MKSLKQILVDISTKNQPQENWMLGPSTPLYHVTHIAVCAPPPPAEDCDFYAVSVWKWVYTLPMHFGVESGMVFEGTTGVYERTYLSIQ